MIFIVCVCRKQPKKKLVPIWRLVSHLYTHQLLMKCLVPVSAVLGATISGYVCLYISCLSSFDLQTAGIF